ncbi:MAG: epoxyqueuosine reductase QueH, partial [Clostridia bacterium]|nr:epoxyqueuosine reductase QueH [Clostridia bacterium]
MKINYQRELDAVLNSLNGTKPRLLIHSCCAPCSSYVLEYLSEYFDITILYYNPNIYPEEEFNKRLLEQQRLVSEMGLSTKVIDVGYQSERFYDAVKGLENLPEGDKRCEKCFTLRLEETAKMAKEAEFDYFTTTLSISPLKDEQLLNKIGKELSEKYGANYLYSDFKKKNGYKRSIELSSQYNLYRQDYCGCAFS